MHLRQGRHLNGIVGDEGGLYERALAELAEELVDELALAHGLVDLHALFEAEGADLVLRLALAVEARLLLDGIEDGQAPEGGAEGDDLAVDLHLGLAVDGGADLLQHLLGEGHAPEQVLVADVELHAGELGVVGLVHALVAEVLAHLVDALEAAHDEALQVELRSDAHVHVLVQGVEVCDERACRCTAGDVLQDGGVHLGVAGIVEDAAHGAYDGGSLEERVLHSGVHHQVDVALAVAQLGVVEGVVDLAVGVCLHHGQRLQALRQHGHLQHVNAHLARLRAEHISLHTDEVAQVEQLLEHDVVQVLVLIGTDGVALHVDLYAPL